VAYKFELLCAAVLFGMAMVLVATTARKSITADEIVLIPSAYYHLVTNDVQLIPQHPPLCKLLAGLPLLLVQPNEWWPGPDEPAVDKNDAEWRQTMHFWQDNRLRFDTICFWARMPMIALTLALGLLTFVFARDFFGPRAGLFAVVLFALEPTILAHGRVVQTDIPAAFGFLLTVYAFYRYVGAPTWRRACALGGAAGVAMLAKYSMVFLGPLLLVAFGVLLIRRRERWRIVLFQGLLAAAALVLVINCGYFFYHRPLSENDSVWVATFFPSSRAAVWPSVRYLRLLLPTDFVMGVYWQLNHGREGHPAGLLGMYSNHGWWYYFPVTFAFKTTIPFLCLAVCSLAWGTWAALRRQKHWLLFLLVPFAAYTGLMMLTPINIGVRYYLPGYLFLVILSAGLVETVWQARRAVPSSRWLAMAAGIFLLSWMVVETGRSYPHYMSYVNQLASSKPRWWYVSDSNVEWGDDVKALAAFLRARGETRVRALLLGGFATLGFYGVEYLDALSPAPEPLPKYIAIGASALNGSTVPSYEIAGKRVSDETRVNTFAAYRNRVPEAVIGNSIYVYRAAD
jgi:4-amino-4-deoxy-L-arabinose transferase-like glycosyltransferase